MSLNPFAPEHIEDFSLFTLTSNQVQTDFKWH